MGEAVMEKARDRVPFGPEMLCIAAAEVLRCAHILGRLEGGEEVIGFRAIEWALTVDGGFTNHAWLMDVKILEGIVRHTVRKEVAIAMAIGTASPPSEHFPGEEILAACNLGGFGRGRELPKRVREESGLILRPKDLQVSHVVIADFVGFATQVGPADRS